MDFQVFILVMSLITYIKIKTCIFECKVYPYIVDGKAKSVLIKQPVEIRSLEAPTLEIKNQETNLILVHF